MIISVSGRIGHGKDLIGKIIQACMEFPNASELSILRIIESGIDNPDTEIKKWADKLKEMLCVMTRTTRKQWEDSTFKATVLDQQWWYWGMELDGGYGKVMLNYLTTSQADLSMYEGLTLIKPTYRNLLELLGTECGRNIIHPNIWCNALMSEYRTCAPTKGTTFEYHHTSCIGCKKPFSGYKRQFICNDCHDSYNWSPNWIITDTRFPNELDAVKSKGGLSIKIVRPDMLTNFATGKSFPIKVHKKEHESETALDKSEFDYLIENSGTVLDLIEKVRQILIKEKII